MQLYITYISGVMVESRRILGVNSCGVPSLEVVEVSLLNNELVTYINKARPLKTEKNLFKMKIHNDPANRDPGAHLWPKSWGR